jgi:hypothetical protein
VATTASLAARTMTGLSRTVETPIVIAYSATSGPIHSTFLRTANPRAALHRPQPITSATSRMHRATGLISSPPVGGISYTEFQGDASVVGLQEAITFANNHNLFATGNVVFVAGVTDGYLLVDANSGGAFTPGTTDYGIVLDGLNNLSLFGAQDVI